MLFGLNFVDYELAEPGSVPYFIQTLVSESFTILIRMQDDFELKMTLSPIIRFFALKIIKNL